MTPDYWGIPTPSGPPPEPAGFEDSREYRQNVTYERESARIDRERIAISNRENMRKLRSKLERGELDTADPARRWYYRLAEGEHHGDRELAQVRDTAYEISPLEEYDPNAVLAWLQTHPAPSATEPARGNTSAAQARAWLAEHRTYNGGPT